MSSAVKLFPEFAREIAWLAGLGACAWFFPRTVLTIEAICAVGTIALVRVEKGIQ